jgi:hypothetical protein
MWVGFTRFAKIFYFLKRYISQFTHVQVLFRALFFLINGIFIAYAEGRTRNDDNMQGTPLEEILNMENDITMRMLGQQEKYTWPCFVKDTPETVVKKNGVRDLLGVLEISYKNKIGRTIIKP